MFIDNVQDGADPGSNNGIAFTASLNETQLIPKDAYLDHLLLNVSGAVATAAVVLETFVGVLSQFTFKAGQEVRIQLSLQDLIALQAAYYKKLPRVWENTDNTGFDFVFGVKIPIQESIQTNQKYTFAATRTAVTNISSEKLGLQAVYYKDSKGRKPIVAVSLAYTTAGATGYTNPGFTIPPLGDMIGLLVFQTTFPTDAAMAYDIQRIQFTEDGQLTSKLHSSSGASLLGQADYGALGPTGETLMNYTYFDFSDEPVDCVGKKVGFIVDVETTAEATRLIPVILKRS